MAGYDDGLDPRQPRDLEVPEYTSLVCFSLSTCAFGYRLMITFIQTTTVTVLVGSVVLFTSSQER